MNAPLFRHAISWITAACAAVALLAFHSAAWGGAVPEPPTPPDIYSAPTVPLFQRVVVLGASVTAGFDSTQPFGGPKTIQLRFANFVEGALASPHEPVMTEANVLLFTRTADIMDRQITATLVAKPSLVIAVDALFWFCYGANMNAEQRVALFDAGLHQLERIDAPMVVGDIPDASKAVGGMLDKNEVPDAKTIARCNERLKAWARSRKNVTLVSLSRIMAGAQANDALTVAGLSWEKGKSHDLLQGDELHPSTHGLAALAIASLDAAATANPPVPPASWRRDLEVVHSAGLARVQALSAPRQKETKAAKAQN